MKEKKKNVILIQENGGICMARKSKKLEEIKELLQEHQEHIHLDSIDTKELEILANAFNQSTDERYQPNTRHKIGDIIMIVLLATLANCNEWTTIEIFCRKKELWLKSFLSLDKGIPSIDTIQRVIAIVKPVELYQVCISYVIEKIEILSPRKKDERDVLSLDGKTSNGSSRKKTDVAAIPSVNTMSVYSSLYGIALTHDYIGEKTNEIPMGPTLIKQLNAPNCIFTWDALNTQKETVKAVSKEADYVGALKGNQHTFHKEVKDFLQDEQTIQEIREAGNYVRAADKENGAFVIREYFMTNDIEWFADRKKWKGLKSFGKEEKTIERKDGSKGHETRYFITSLDNDIDMFAYAVRSHWGVENNLHAPLDIVFKEDKNKTLEKNGAKGLGVIRRIALLLLKMAQPYYKKSLNSMRYELSCDFEQEIQNIFRLLNTEALKEQLSTNER